MPPPPPLQTPCRANPAQSPEFLRGSCPPLPLPTDSQPSLTDEEQKAAGVNFDTYLKFTDTVAIYPAEVDLPYATLGLNGEPGELAGQLSEVVAKMLMTSEGTAVDEKRETLFQLNELLKRIAKISAEAEKFKKALRKGEKKVYPLKPLTQEERQAMALELGDSLWYVARVAKHLGYSLSDIAKMNVDKLTSRKARNVLHGSGDNR